MLIATAFVLCCTVQQTHGQESKVKAVLALEFADVKQTTLSYGDGVKVAEKTGEPLVTAVGREPVTIPGTVSARTDTLAGFDRGSFVVSLWIDGRHVGYPVKDVRDIGPTIVLLRGECAVKTASSVCIGGVCYQR